MEPGGDPEHPGRGACFPLSFLPRKPAALLILVSSVCPPRPAPATPRAPSAPRAPKPPAGARVPSRLSVSLLRGAWPLQGLPQPAVRVLACGALTKLDMIGGSHATVRISAEKSRGPTRLPVRGVRRCADGVSLPYDAPAVPGQWGTCAGGTCRTVRAALWFPGWGASPLPPCAAWQFHPTPLFPGVLASIVFM